MVQLKLGGTVGEKGQVVIPKHIRDILGIMPRSNVLFSIEENKIIIERKIQSEILTEFLTATPKRIKFSKKVDWDEEYNGQFK